MRHLPVIFLLALAGCGGSADRVERACLNSDRGPEGAGCRCIQQAADIALDAGDQRRAAEIFGDPHSSQVIRQSDRPSDERFWKRYKRFGSVAERFCS